ncbi:SSI family serine proteinase inhibitor [Actinomadura scrupuli]|uniref:SSI family serine proteinase inhibitor n=1 Tax=Actinomadura scrupuli TaxID=559629 RepID=UPI003D954CC5
MLPGLIMGIALTGCGSEKADDPSAGVSSGGPGWGNGEVTPGQTAQSPTTLSVAYKQSAKAAVKTWTLTCDPVGGDHPNAKLACAELDKAAAAGKDPFAPTPKGQSCTMIYGGPDTSTVTGTWQGKKIDARFSRKDGCQVTRWTALAPLLGELPRPR